MAVGSFVLLSLGLAGLAWSDGDGKLLLLGWTGDGKTEFCERYDGSKCKKPKAADVSGEASDTTEVHFGNYMIDTPGFGDNRVAASGEDALTASLAAIEKSLVAVNRTKINGIAWLVPCTERRTKKEAIDAMRLSRDMMGEPIPIIAIFNPGAPYNRCVKDGSEFQALARQHGITITEVVHFDRFDLQDFRSRYTTDYQVMVPGDLHKVLEARDVNKLASTLKDIRKRRCESLPSELQETRNYIAALRAEIKVENQGANCRMEDCHFDTPTTRGCTSQVCSSEKKECWRSGPFGLDKDCVVVCQEYTTVTDAECERDNEMARNSAEQAYANCGQKAEKLYKDCREDHEASQHEIKKKNHELRESIDLLAVAERDQIAKHRTCDKALGVNSEL